jgi:hypothetical protein
MLKRLILMSNIKWIIFLLIAIASFRVQASLCTPYLEQVNGSYGGYFELNGSICSTTADFSVQYSDFNPMNGVSASGNIQLHFSVDNEYNPSTMRLVFYGGPLMYRIDGQYYSVLFQSLEFNVNMNSDVITSVSGGINLNGTYIPASANLFGYLM